MGEWLCCNWYNSDFIQGNMLGVSENDDDDDEDEENDIDEYFYIWYDYCSKTLGYSVFRHARASKVGLYSRNR